MSAAVVEEEMLLSSDDEDSGVGDIGGGEQTQNYRSGSIRLTGQSVWIWWQSVWRWWPLVELKALIKLALPTVSECIYD